MTVFFPGDLYERPFIDVFCNVNNIFFGKPHKTCSNKKRGICSLRQEILFFIQRWFVGVVPISLNHILEGGEPATNISDDVW